MANKYRKIEFRFTKELIIIVAVLLAMLVATIILSQPTKSEKFVSEWSGAGSSIQVNTLYEEVSTNQLNNKLTATSGNVFVLVATSSDANSVKLFDEILNQAASFKVERVYLVNAAGCVGDREEDKDVDNNLKNLETALKVAKLDSVPTLLLYVNGAFSLQLNSSLVEEQAESYTEAVKQLLVYNYPMN